jgi:hypothetical protein
MTAVAAYAVGGHQPPAHGDDRLMQATTQCDAFSNLRSVVDSGNWSAENFDPSLAQVDAHFILFGIVPILMQGR